MDIEFYREKPIKRIPRTLPAHCYNKLHLLFSHSKDEQLFIPVRSIQFLAVIDKHEVFFADAIHRQTVILSWNHFKPQQREKLDQPVEFMCEIYEPEWLDVMIRLHGEFYVALEQFEKKQPKPKTSGITRLHNPLSAPKH